jgi:hypothetical protein
MPTKISSYELAWLSRLAESEALARPTRPSERRLCEHMEGLGLRTRQ